MTRGAIFFALVVASCHRSDASSSNVTPEPPQVARGAGDAEAVVAVKDSGSCSAITKARRDADAGAVTGVAENCLVTKGGAWGFVSEDPVLPSSYPIAGFSNVPRLRPVHASGASLVLGAVTSWRTMQKTSTFDFDGDGEAELIIEGEGLECASSGDGQCSQPMPHVEVFTFKDGAVSPLPALAALAPPPGMVPAHITLSGPGKLEREQQPISFETADDIDHDGRPDFSTVLYYVVDGTDGDVSSLRGAGPHFLAHALRDGSFSLTDPVAMGALAHECGDMPAVETAGGPALVASAVCARLAGQAPAQIKRHYDARCASIFAANKRFKDPARADWQGAILCRVETEGGWSSRTGMPLTLLKMLEETSPVLTKTADAAKP